MRIYKMYFKIKFKKKINVYVVLLLKHSFIVVGFTPRPFECWRTYEGRLKSHKPDREAGAVEP